jgi:preprotein translocase subunit SecG
METILTILIIIASALLVLVVMMQNPKGGGLSTDFGSPHQLGGVKRSNDFIEKATWTLAGGLAAMSLIMAIITKAPSMPKGGDAPAKTEQPAKAPQK